MKCVQDFAKTDSQASKWAELKGYSQKWVDASLLNTMTVDLDILSPLRRLSLSMQNEVHDPVKNVRKIQEFTQLKEKLKCFVSESLSKTNSNLTYYKTFSSDITVDDDGRKVYQGITLDRFEHATDRVSKAIEYRFKSLDSPVFTHLVRLLDVSTWG